MSKMAIPDTAAFSGVDEQTTDNTMQIVLEHEVNHTISRKYPGDHHESSGHLLKKLPKLLRLRVERGEGRVN